MMRDWANYDRAHDFSPCNSVQCSKGLGKELAGLSGALSLIGKCFTFLWIVMFPTPQQSWVALSHFWNTSTLYLFVFDMWHRSLSLSPSLSHFWETYQGGNRAWESQEGGKCRCGREITAQSDIFASRQHAKNDDFVADGDGRKIRSKSDIFCATPAHWTVLTCSLGIRRNISDLKTQIRLSNISKR